MTAPTPSTHAPPVPPLADGPAILCQGLTKTYGSVQALVDLDLSVPYGSVFGFLGRNGAGKTTTMRMLAGLALPTAGQRLGRRAGNHQPGALRPRPLRLPAAGPSLLQLDVGARILDYVAQIQGLELAERKRQIAQLLAPSLGWRRLPGAALAATGRHATAAGHRPGFGWGSARATA